jgi:hypothetical protein
MALFALLSMAKIIAILELLRALHNPEAVVWPWVLLLLASAAGATVQVLRLLKHGG